MKKTLIASAMALTFISATNAKANMAVTLMDFGGGSPSALSVATGSINDDGTLGAFSGEYFFAHAWDATQETAIITNTNGVTWAGSGPIGSWDYSDDIALMTDDQVAVGIIWNWNTNNDIPMLAVFDCVSTAGICTGQVTGEEGAQFGGIQIGAIVGPVPAFSGTGNLSAVPVPAAAWLMGSGLLGLAGVARRRKQR